MNFFEELKRRNVVRVGIAYGVAAWVILQVADLVLENIEAPPWVIKTMMLIVALGFIASLIIAWAYELTPEGIKREADVDRSQSITGSTGRKLNHITVGFLVVAVAYFVWESRFSDRSAGPAAVEPSTVAEVAPAAVEMEVETEPSIAVLPFVNMSTDEEQEFFSDGISEELLNLLVKVDGLKVASRTSSFTYKGSSLNLADIADELQVDHVLEGSVRKADNRVRITAQLIDADTDRHLWSDTYDRELTDIFGIQDEIANAIVEALRTELGVLADSAAVSATVATENLDAYQLYLKARGLFLARAELQTAVALFEQAVALDPEFARAWADLAATYSVMESWGFVEREYTDLAKQAAQTAMGLDESLSTPVAVLAQVSNNTGDMLTGMQYLDKAIELDPNNATHYLWRGIDYSTLGFQKKSVADLEQCLELDPAYENCKRHLAFTYLVLNNNETGIRLYQEGAVNGFTGSRGMFVQRLMSVGEKMLATQLVWGQEAIGSLFPGTAVVEAMEFPSRDHSKGLAKFESFLESIGADSTGSAMYFAIFKAYHRVSANHWFPRWFWLDENSGFRKSEYFEPYLRELGVLAYWRANGFPPTCRPLGEEDFECE